MGKKKETIVVRKYYDLKFKHTVCKEHINEGFGINELQKKYKLSSHSMIHNWLRVLKYLPHKCKCSSDIIEIGAENNIPSAMSSISKSSEDNSELKRLKKELEDAKILAEGYKRMIEIAEQEYKISIRKKPNTK